MNDDLGFERHANDMELTHMFLKDKMNEKYSLNLRSL
ncbi:hypothetical protein BPSP16_12220 [Brachyspira pilosicoli SP16]|nr:hypothetical protein BPSP16_12220 [Brachyspira pilosicoli SP16]